MKENMMISIREMEKLIENRVYNNCGFVGSVIMNCVKKYRVSIADFEYGLRSVGSRVHLVAYPITPRMTSQYFSSIPNSSERFEYFLWVSMDLNNFTETLNGLGVTKEENIENLKRTGFLNLITM